MSVPPHIDPASEDTPDARDSQALIRGLAEDLSPVQPIPRLRHALLAVLCVWGVVAALGALLLGVRPDLVEWLLAARGSAVVYAGLVLAGASGVVAGLALGVPGRERLAAGWLLVGALGLALAAGLGSLRVAMHPAARELLFAPADFRCLGVACAIGLLPALGVVAFVGRAAPLRPLAATLAAAAGTAALGAVTAQMSCPSSNPSHMLMGHVLAPAAGVLLLTLPLLLALRRLARHPH